MNHTITKSLVTHARRLAAASLALFAGAPLAGAHPGHSLTDATVAHLVTSPGHLVVLVLLGAVMFLGAQLVQQRLPRRALQAAGCLAFFGGVILFGLRA